MYQQMRQPESDHTLLNAFATRHCQRAFALLVDRHGAMVYSAALRQVRRRDLADDVTQAVFLVLAQRAGSIPPRVPVGAWLHKTCRYIALNALKVERRRSQHERAAIMAQQQNKAAGWSSLWPILDEGIEHLADADKTAIVLRFLEQRSLAEVGEQMGVSEDAAGMRVSRALERLRAFFHRRGIGLSTANLGVVLGLQLPSTMSPHLANIVSHPSAAPMGAFTAEASPTISTRAIELARHMDRALKWDAARSAAITLVAAAAVFVFLCTVAQWWVSPTQPPAVRDEIAMAEPPAPSSDWMTLRALAVP